MERLTENKIILIVRKTRLEELKRRFNTEGQARFYIEHLGADFSDYKAEDRTYKQTVAQAQEILSQLGRLQVLDREFIPNFIFGKDDTVVVLGQDGLVVNVLKYLRGQLVIGVNPDPARWEGVLLPFTVERLAQALTESFEGKRKIKQVTMAKAALNTGQVLYGVNDIFIGPKTHGSARYRIECGGAAENHSSSGVIVSTGLGSTGWLRSILAGATGITSSLTGKSLSMKQPQAVAWDVNQLFFSVREPWPSKISSAKITFGQITARRPLKLLSQMPENGVIFSDGMENDFLEFNSGTLATLTLAEEKGRLVV